jgi:hypothetical protein
MSASKGNRIEIVGYDNIQFSKAPNVLRGMGLMHLSKSARAIKELAEREWRQTDAASPRVADSRSRSARPARPSPGTRGACVKPKNDRDQASARQR